MSELDLSGMSPLWMVEIYHRNPGATPVWMRAVNAVDESAAVRTAIHLFVADGLNEVLIDRIEHSELKGEEDA